MVCKSDETVQETVVKRAGDYAWGVLHTQEYGLIELTQGNGCDGRVPDWGPRHVISLND